MKTLSGECNKVAKSEVEAQRLWQENDKLPEVEAKRLWQENDKLPEVEAKRLWQENNKLPEVEDLLRQMVDSSADALQV